MTTTQANSMPIIGYTHMTYINKEGNVFTIRYLTCLTRKREPKTNNVIPFKRKD